MGINFQISHSINRRDVIKMQVLIVDNKLRARQSMRALLGAWYPGTQIHEAANGIEAVSLAEELQPDLVLMDVRMPKVDGLEATRLIKAKQLQIKVILLSMYPEYEVEALASGADAFISKSDPPEKFRKTLESVLQKN
jgi:DNA-binding NarL/FixJ family response regulator